MTGLKRTLRSRRGFTLVELVVVLVIAGITASFAVPALTGYIDNAKEKQAVSETQACVETVTRIAAQKYAEWQKNTTYQLAGGKELTSSAEFQPLVGCTGTTSNTPPAVTGGDVALTEGSGQYLLHVSNYEPGGFPATGSTADISAAASVTGTIQTLTCSSSGQVVYLVYTSKDGITVVYTNNGRSSTVSTKADAVVVPTPGPDSSGGGGETGGGGTTGGGETGGGGTTGGGETGSTATAGEKQFIIHMQDVSTGNYAPFAKRKYHIKSGENSFDVTSDKNGDILLKISPHENERHLPETVIGDTPTFITEDKVPAGYQSIPSDTIIYINVRIKENNDYDLDSIQDGGNYNSGVVDMANRRLTLMRFPVAKLKLRVTDRDEKALPGAIFEIMCDSKPVATLTCNDKGECSIPVKLHDGDNIGDSVYLTAESQPNHTYVIKETYPPAGYQGDITCSFNLYYQPYPSEPTPHHETWFYINSYNGDHKELGSYDLEKTVDKVGREDSFHVINTERKLCTVYIRKIDDAGNPVSDANLKLTADNNSNAIVNTNVMEYFVSSKQFTTTTAAAVFEVRQGQRYTLEEKNAPAEYTKADNLTFTVEDGCATKEVTMIDHNSSEDKSDIKFDKVTFNQANNWAHKLTKDDNISFNGGEIICWKGIAYYNYDKDSTVTFNIPNSNRDDYEKNPTKLNNAPDPMVFLNKHLKDENSGKKAADYIVSLTGKAYFYNEKNVTLKKGDIIIPAAYGDGVPVITKNEEGKKVTKNKKVYVYIGDKDLPLTDKTLSDKKENFTTLEHKPQDKDNKAYNFTLNK